MCSFHKVSIDLNGKYAQNAKAKSFLTIKEDFVLKPPKLQEPVKYVFTN